jgi:hypothetical protein
MTKYPPLIARMVVLWFALSAALVLRGNDSNQKCKAADFKNVVDIHVSQANGKTVVREDPVCANKVATVNFHAENGGRFTAAFDRPHPFLDDRRFYATGFFETGQIQVTVGMEAHYEVCYYPATGPNPKCLDPKVIVNPVGVRRPVISTNLVDFGSQPIGTTHQQKVYISSGSHVPVAVNVEPLRGSPFTSTGCISPKDEKNKCTVTITFTPTGVEPESKSLIVRYEDEGTKEMPIKVTGRGKPRQPR